MKNITLLTTSLLISIASFTQSISRGPDIGEIYFLGPTSLNTYGGIYRSIDFGETAVLMADNPQPAGYSISGLVADKTPGVVYFTTMTENLYYSDNYGQTGSWVYRNNGISAELLSGVYYGSIYNHIKEHSGDYGLNFSTCSLNGFFGYLLDPALDCEENTGYALVKKWGVSDTTYLLISYNNFENLQIQHVFYAPHFPLQRISRGGQPGELISVMGAWPLRIMYTTDYGVTWQDSPNHDTYIHNFESIRFCGGRQLGELYILVRYLQMSGQISHAYIYHSLDYGETFDIFHPVSYGPDPYYIDFDAEPRTGPFPLTVQFINNSSGDYVNWAWDFDGDSIWDSFEKNPIYTYQDTGKYNVILKGIPDDWPPPDSLKKRDFIHVKDTTTAISSSIKSDISIFPVPCKNKLYIEFADPVVQAGIIVYDMKGIIVKKASLQVNNKKHSQYALDMSDLKEGIYFVKINISNSIIINKIIRKD